MTSAPSTEQHPWPRWLGADARLAGPLGLFLAVALWFVTRPYSGVRHDAVLYLGQALDHLWPQVLNADLFFQYGSQDKFSLFSTVLAALIRCCGVGPAEIGLLLACQFAFVAATWALTAHLSAQTRWLAVLCAAAFPHKYASLNVFGFAENFLTARSIAEPLALFALAAWLAHRRLLALVLFAVAGAMHPLIVLPVLVIVWIVQVRADRRWLLLLLLAIPILALAVAKVAPFDGLLRRYDDVWWSAVAEFNKQVLVSRWDYFDWQSVATDVTILYLALRDAGDRLHQLIVATLWASAGLLAATFVGVDLLHDVLLTSVQLWRVLWITHLLALICLPMVALGYWRDGRPGQLVATASVAALVAVGASLPMAWVLVLWLLATIYLQRHAATISMPVHRLACGATIAVIVLTTLVEATTKLRRVADSPELNAVTHPALILLTLPVLALLFAALLLVVMRRLPTLLGISLVSAVLAVGLLNWDQRSAWSVEIESSMSRKHPFDQYIGPKAQVYWADEQMLATWLLLKRPTYYSLQQGSGLLFNRGTALEFERRHAVFIGLELQAHLCVVVAAIIGGSAEDDSTCSPTLPVVTEICQSPAHPDFMVFPVKLPVGVVDTWTFAPGAPVSPKTYYLYDCARFH
jgi:hypothetical protein